MAELDLKVEQKINSVEEYKFEPIKGYPMLNWKGKRPFTSTQYYPAQLKETHGQEVNGWFNKIFWGDNLQVMSHLLKEFRGQVDLIYIDPPFDSKADYKKKISLKGATAINDNSAFEEKQYTDIWSNDEYLQFMYERFVLLRELLSEKGSIIVHVDYRKGPYLKCILDEIFGNSNYKNEIIWHYSGWIKASSSQFARKHDSLYFYSKSSSSKFNTIYESWVEEFTLEELSKTVVFSDSNGDYFIVENNKIYLKDILANYIKNRKQAIYNDSVGEYLWADGRNTVKRYLKDVLIEGRAVDDVWDIKAITTSSKERYDYPTQKPEILIERIISACSNINDLVFDCFMGSGTTQAVAMKLGRRFIGADINLGAIQTTTKRLLNIAVDLNGKIQEETKYTGFSVYNVNNYDVFRNPLEAKDLLIKALEIQPLPNNSLYDGEKDGRMVKIMPINRIATRADLNELITGFDYKKFEKANDSNTNKAVEYLLLVCMGHEPNLAAELQSAVPYKLDIEVVDILRDKSNLEFKRDAEAEIVIEGGKLLIREFYPMNLLQKLSLMKENVDNWKELVDSVMIDFNFDGSVFEPQIVDVPEGNNFVRGIYSIPTNAGTIKVKITDLLSESFEKIITN